MNIIKARYEITTPIDAEDVIKRIEEVGRTCYKSEDQIREGSAEAFIRRLIKRGHEAMIEHYSISVRFICDRGISHELVRHRIASFAQESTRYCNYSQEKFGQEITVIEPFFFVDRTPNEHPKMMDEYSIWRNAMQSAEDYYFALIAAGASAQEARSVLPNSLKTEIVVTMNLREWRHFFKLRTASGAHPQMQELTRPLLRELQAILPVIFGDIEVK